MESHDALVLIAELAGAIAGFSSAEELELPDGNWGIGKETWAT